MDCSSLQGVIIRDIQAYMSSWRGIKASPQNLPIAATWSIPRKIFFPRNVLGDCSFFVVCCFPDSLLACDLSKD